jgi:hypothetical protein
LGITQNLFWRVFAVGSIEQTRSKTRTSSSETIRITVLATGLETELPDKSQTRLVSFYDPYSDFLISVPVQMPEEPVDRLRHEPCR